VLLEFSLHASAKRKFMTPYNDPLDNIRFLINDIFDYPQHYAKFSQLNDLTPDVVDAIISECANFCEKELAPLNQSGDDEGCQFDNGKATTPKGFKQAYQRYIAAGWQSLSYP
jgi:hypothetical protein